MDLTQCLSLLTSYSTLLEVSLPIVQQYEQQRATAGKQIDAIPFPKVIDCVYDWTRRCGPEFCPFWTFCVNVGPAGQSLLAGPLDRQCRWMEARPRRRGPEGLWPVYAATQLTHTPQGGAMAGLCLPQLPPPPPRRPYVIRST
jgi:hypothetical protein